jgi:hypothetical protein
VRRPDRPDPGTAQPQRPPTKEWCVARMMCRIGVFLVWLCGVSALAYAQGGPPPPPPAPPAGQPAPAPDMLRIFLDCDSCDEEYLRQNVGFVDYVRDRTVADLHVLVTTQDTGGGGSSWVAKFIGLGRLQGQDRTLRFTTPSTATSDDRRKEFARVFKIGLVAYAADTAVAPQLDVTWKKPAAAAPGAKVKDPWNYWVFRTSVNGNRNGEKSSSSTSYSLSFSANRTTDKWKVSVSTYGNKRTSTFAIDETTTIKSVTSSWEVTSLLVKSLGPKWSIGTTGGASHSSFSNTDRSISFAPGLEYDFFPYSESSRRSLTVRYTAGAVHNKYAELTVFDKLSETVPKHYLSVVLGLRQPWGSLNIYSNYSQQINHLDRYRESIFSDTSVRLFKGFSFNVFAEYDKIADQISLTKGGATETEVLLRLQQLQTNYSYYLSFGVSYSFGSIFNSIVNPRFSF